MPRTICVLFVVAFTAGGASLVSAADAPAVKPAAEQPAEAKPQAKKEMSSAPEAKPQAKKEPASAAEAKPQAKKELSPEMAALRDRVRQTVGNVFHQPFNTGESSVADVIQFCRAFGCRSEIREGGPSGEKLNGITCLCWNIPCGGYSALTVYEGHLAARVGYGCQESPAQLAAVLALARVPPEYPARAGQRVATVADLVESEKLACRSGEDQSWRLIALAQYVSQPSWKNAQGEEWSVERMVREELKRAGGQVPEAISTRLLALSWTLDRRACHHLSLAGDFLAAKKYVAECQDYLLASQNSDGSWGRAAGRDAAAALAASGGPLEWLVLSLPEERLQGPKIVQAVSYVDSLLSTRQYSWNFPALGSRDLAAAMTAAHALYAYDATVFAPADPSPAAEGKVTEAGGKPATPSPK